MRPNSFLYKTSLSIILITCFLCSIKAGFSYSNPSVHDKNYGSQKSSNAPGSKNSEDSNVFQESASTPLRLYAKDIIVLNCPIQNEETADLSASVNACMKGVERELNRKKGSIAFVDLDILGESSLQEFDHVVIQSLYDKKSLKLWTQGTSIESLDLEGTGYARPNLILKSSSEELLKASKLVISDQQAVYIEQLSQEKIFNIPYSGQEMQRIEFPKLKLSGATPSGFILLVCAVVAALVIIGISIIKLIKKKRSASMGKEQQMEKRRFISSKKPSLDTSFKDFSLNQEDTNRNGNPATNENTKKSFSLQNKGSDGKGIQVLKLEDNGDVSADPENVFTHIDNSPKSLAGGESPTSSVRDTPKHLDFKIEFSMIEGDSKLKSARTGRENVLEQEEEN